MGFKLVVETQLPGGVRQIMEMNGVRRPPGASSQWRAESTCPPEGAGKAQPGDRCLLQYGPSLAGASDFVQ